jgi:type IV secretory pathway TrbD component
MIVLRLYVLVDQRWIIHCYGVHIDYVMHGTVAKLRNTDILFTTIVSRPPDRL